MKLSTTLNALTACSTEKARRSEGAEPRVVVPEVGRAGRSRDSMSVVAHGWRDSTSRLDSATARTASRQWACGSGGLISV